MLRPLLQSRRRALWTRSSSSTLNWRKLNHTITIHLSMFIARASFENDSRAVLIQGSPSSCPKMKLLWFPSRRVWLWRALTQRPWRMPTANPSSVPTLLYPDPMSRVNSLSSLNATRTGTRQNIFSISKFVFLNQLYLLTSSQFCRKVIP